VLIVPVKADRFSDPGIVARNPQETLVLQTFLAFSV
jgi:hypothetical protein